MRAAGLPFPVLDLHRIAGTAGDLLIGTSRASGLGISHRLKWSRHSRRIVPSHLALPWADAAKARSRPITFAVFMLIDGSNLVGSYMGATARVLGRVRQ